MNTLWIKQWNAYLRHSVGFFVAMVCLFAPVEALAQGKNAPKETASSQNLQLEIFLTVKDDTSINVYIDGELEDTATHGVTPCPTRDYNWGASNEGGHPTTECPGGWTELDADKLYEIKFDVDDGDTFTYTYFQCDTNYSNVSGGKFYCPNGDGSQQDLHFIYEDEEMRVGPDSHVWGPDNLTTHFTSYFDDYWLLPHHGFGLNVTEANKIGFFVTPQTESPYQLTDEADLLVPSGKTWTWDDVTLKFASGTKLDIDGTLYVNDMTFTASGSSWSGISFSSSSGGVLDGVTVDKVQSYGGGAVHIN